MTKIKLLCLLILSFKFVDCNAFSFKDIGDKISELTSELEFGNSESQMQSDDSNVDRDCSEKCSKEITELKKNMTELYMAFLALHAEFAHLSQHIVLHEKALKHIAIMGHKRTGHQHNESYSENTKQHYHEDSRKCNKCNKKSMDDDEDEDTNVRKIHSHHIDDSSGHDEHDSHNKMSLTVNENERGDEQNDDEKQKKDSSEESSEEQDSSATNVKVTVVKPISDPNNSQYNGAKIALNPMKIDHSEHAVNEQIHSTDNELKNWFDLMLSDIHKNNFHKNPIHSIVNHSNNSSAIHSHHIITDPNTKTDEQKITEEKLEEMEKALTSEETIFATCDVRPNRHIALLNQQDIRGKISLWQLKSNRGPLHMHIKLKGFKVATHVHRPPTREVRETNLMPIEQEPDEPTKSQSQAQRVIASHTHGFHVHEYGNLTRDCQSVGAHYNPFELTHGGPHDVIRHVGDLGNIRCDENGETDIELSFSQVSLSGEHSIINRSLVIHHMADDFGRNPKNPASLTTGSSGIRIACCVIEEVKILPKETDSQSKVAAVAAPAPSNKRRREVSQRNHYQDLQLSELLKRFARYENGRKFDSLFERKTLRNLRLR